LPGRQGWVLQGSALVEAHCLGIGTAYLGGNYKGPAATIDLPCPIDQGKWMYGAAKIGPGGHIARIAIPLTGFFHSPAIYRINRLIAIILKSVIGEISGYVAPIQSKTGDFPLSIGHCLNDEVFLDILNRFFTSAQKGKREKA
jgi:hypothetical protein